MADLAALKQNPDFLALTPEDQQAILTEAGGAPAAPAGPGLVQQGEDVLQGILGSVSSPQGREDLSSAAGAGVRGSVAGLDRLAANAAMLVKNAAAVLPPAAQPTPAIPEALQSVENLYRSRGADTMKEAVAGRRAGVAPAVAEIVAGLPIGLMTAAAAAELGGPVAGFAGLGALGAADQGPEAAATDALKGAVLGGIFKGSERFSPWLRVPAVGVATYALSSEPDTTRRVTEAVAMGGLAALGSPGRRLPSIPAGGAEMLPPLPHLAEMRAPEDIQTRAELDQHAQESPSEPAAVAPLQLPAAEANPPPPAEPNVPAPPMTPEEVRAAYAAKIGSQPPKPTISNMGDRIRQSVFDDTHGFLMAERATEGGPVSDGAWEAVRRLRGVPEIVEKSLEYGTPEFVPDPMVEGGRMVRFTGKPLAETFAELHKGVPTGQLATNDTDSWNYSIARQSKELAAQGRERLLTPQEIQGGLALETPARAKWFDEMKADARKTGDFMQKAGLVSSKQREAWNRNEFVFSYWRDFTGDLSRGGGAGTPGGKPVYRLFGSDRNLRDPLTSFLGGRAKRIQLALENEARLKAIDQYGAEPGLMEKVPARSRMAQVRREEAIRQVMKPLDENGDPAAAKAMRAALQADPSLPEMLSMWAGRTAPPGEDIQTVFRNGKPEYWRVKDPVLLHTFDSIQRTGVGGSTLQFFNRWRRIFQNLTTATPLFIEKNMIRDPIAGSVFSQTGHEHFTKALEGIIGAARGDADYRDFIANGGGNGTLRDPEQFRNEALGYAKRHALNPMRIITLPRDAIRALNEIGNVVELGPRLGEFKAARRQGESAGRSAFLGREVTTDYAQHGDNPTVRAANAILPFFSSMIASSDRFYRGLREPDQRAAVATKIGTVAVLSLMLHAMNRRDPEFDKLPDWDRNGYWHIPDGRGDWYRIPKAWEIGAVGSAAERMYDSYIDAPSAQDKNLATDIAKIAAQNFNSSLGPFQAGLEQWGNKVWYTGAPIVPPSIEDRQPWDQATAGTSATLRAAGRLERNLPTDYQFAPARAQALIRALFSNTATYGLWASDHLFFPGSEGINWDDEPTLGAFVEQKGKYNRFREAFYENLARSNAVMRTLRDAATRGDAQVVGELAQDPMAAVAAPLRRASVYLSALDKTIQGIDSDPQLTHEQRVALHKDKVAERDALMEQMVGLSTRAKAAAAAKGTR